MEKILLKLVFYEFILLESNTVKFKTVVSCLKLLKRRLISTTMFCLCINDPKTHRNMYVLSRLFQKWRKFCCFTLLHNETVIPNLIPYLGFRNSYKKYNNSTVTEDFSCFKPPSLPYLNLTSRAFSVVKWFKRKVYNPKAQNSRGFWVIPGHHMV